MRASTNTALSSFSGEEAAAGELLDAVLDPGWMVRRKDSVSFGSESLLKRSHSFDFSVPSELIQIGPGWRRSAVVPLGFWWKAPGKYSNIDFVDEAGRALPLSTSDSDETLTIALIHEYARRVLCRSSLHDVSVVTLQFLVDTVLGDPVTARGEVNWLAHQATPLTCRLSDRDRLLANPPDLYQAELRLLMQDPGFAELVEVCAMASIFTVTLTDRLDSRRVIKLRYEETCTGRLGTDTFLTPKSVGKRIRARFRAVALPFGLAPYVVDLGNAFVRGTRYHFEEDPPPGLRFTNVSWKRKRGHAQTATECDPRVHLYEKGLTTDTYLTVRGDIVVTDEWLNLAIVCTAVSAAVLFAIVNNIATFDPSGSQNVITLAVLVPSVATSIIWRRVHWLVVRLQGHLRNLFGVVGLVLFYVALRIAASPTDPIVERRGHHLVTVGSRLTDASQIHFIAELALGLCALVLLLLVVARSRSAIAD